MEALAQLWHACVSGQRALPSSRAAARPPCPTGAAASKPPGQTQPSKGSRPTTAHELAKDLAYFMLR
eukprot:10378562-Lingulodinium_polyedra.AAC.1